MNLPDVQPQVFGAPYQTADGATVITVSAVRSRGSMPVGIFVIKDGIPTWSQAVDRIALIGVLAGLIAGALATLAMVRRPPWPDMHFSEHR
ncbi:MAG: hypothetical protein JO152_10730 [Mycobacteriaceae bacterium]|nr:hypothetical protein [Mycobacteriaceae bacterium]